MFSLFKKKQIIVEVVPHEERRFVAGVQTVTERKTYKSDVRTLQKHFYSLREKLKDRFGRRASEREDLFGPRSPFIRARVTYRRR